MTIATFPAGPTNRRENLVRFSENPLQFFQKLYADYGGFVYARIATRDMYLVSSPELLRAVFIDLNDILEKTEHTKDSLRMAGQGLLNISGEVHRRHRRLIQPIFTPAWVESYTSTLLDCALETAAEWQASQESHQEIDLARSLSQLALSVVSKTVFGLNAGVSRPRIEEAIHVFQRYSAEILKRSRVTNVSPEEMEAAIKAIHSVVETMLEQPESTGTDLISLMRRAVDPETGERLTTDEIRDEAVTFLLAGHETTGTALAWIWYLLAKNPDVEARLVAEMDQAVGERLPTLADISALPYTLRVIKETLRLYPPAWLVGRRIVAPTQLGGFDLPYDSSLTICPYVFHRNPVVFPEPEQFNPDRFLVEPPKYTYLPFGVGPRVCIGQHLALNELVLSMATLLPRFRAIVAEDYQAIPEPMISLTMRDGLPAKIVLREPR